MHAFTLHQQTGRQAGRQADRQAGRQAGRQVLNFTSSMGSSSFIQLVVLPPIHRIFEILPRALHTVRKNA
jgi:predicted transposase YdaD